MLIRYQSKSKIRVGGEKGAALIELSLLVPLCVFLAFATFDLANLLLQYMKLTQVVHEGTRLLSRLPDVETGKFCSVAVSGCPEPAASSSQRTAQDRVNFLLRLEKFDIQPGYFVESSLDSGIVNLTLRASFQGSFILTSILPVTVSSSGPYLFESS